MQAVTLSIAAIFSLSVLLLRPTRGLALYFVVLLAYPTFLVVQLGTLDIGAARIVGGVLLMRCLADSKLLGRMKWCALDTWVVIAMVVEVGVPLIAWKMPGMKVVENRGGYVMNTFLAYFVTRLCISDYRDLKTVARWVGPFVAILAVLGIVEAFYGVQPFFALRRFCPWRGGGEGGAGLDFTTAQTNDRLGYFRAVGPSGHPILFGASFVLFLPLLWALRHERQPWRTWAYALAVLATIGALSSMSSGPWMMATMLWGCLILERWKGLAKPLLWTGLAGIVVVDIISNRTFYHVLASFANPVGGTGWHRARLIDLAVDNFGRWWLLGYGGVDPGWGPQLGMTWTDLTSHYIWAGVHYGIWGVIALVGVLSTVLWMLVKAGRRAKDPLFISWCWGLGSVFAVLVVAFVALTFFDQSGTFFYGLLGMAASSVQGQPAIEQAAAKARVRRARLRATAPRPEYVAAPV
jgi:hypothetical protein